MPEHMQDERRNDPDAPVWFITGCSTGFGRELASAVLARGYRAVVSQTNVALPEIGRTEV